MTAQIGCILGSLARESINRRLAGRLTELAPPGLAITEISIRDLPLYSYDLDASRPPPAGRFKSEVSASDGIRVVTPEYNRSVPGPTPSIRKSRRTPPAAGPVSATEIARGRYGLPPSPDQRLAVASM